MLIVSPIVGFCNCSVYCCALLYVHSSIAIILMGKRELVALLCLSSWCLLIVVWFFLTMPWTCLQFVIVVFPIAADRKHASTYSPVAFRSVHTGIEPPFLLKIYYAITACMTQGFTSRKYRLKEK